MTESGTLIFFFFFFLGGGGVYDPQKYEAAKNEGHTVPKSMHTSSI